MLDLLPADLAFDQMAFLAIVLCAAAFMSGMSGFGFSAIGAATLLVLPPSLGIPLLMTLSTATQVLAIRLLKLEMMPLREWRPKWPDGPGPYVLGGLLGAPMGVWLLMMLPTPLLMACFGGLLLAYAAYSILKRSSFLVAARPGAGIRIGVGFIGGVLGGFTAFPGAAVVIWTGLTGTSKTAARSIVQPYILTLQVYSLAVLTISAADTFGPSFWHLLFLLMPVVLPYTWAGVRTYQSCTEARARRLTFYLLGGSGAGLLMRGALSL
jgi:uncharacterized protein